VCILPQVHKRFYNLHWLLAEAAGLEQCVAAERSTYRRGKARAFTETFTLAPEDQQLVTNIAAADADFLAAAGLMDYSLLVGTLTKRMLPNGALPDFPQGGAIRPLIQITETPQGPVATALYLGIIDYLQGWTTGKKVAHVIKELFAPHPISTIEPHAYRRQFKEANNRRFRAGPAKRGPRLIAALASRSVPVASGQLWGPHDSNFPASPDVYARPVWGGQRYGSGGGGGELYAMQSAGVPQVQTPGGLRTWGASGVPHQVPFVYYNV
jgi:hypothetical protein